MRRRQAGTVGSVRRAHGPARETGSAVAMVTGHGHRRRRTKRRSIGLMSRERTDPHPQPLTLMTSLQRLNRADVHHFKTRSRTPRVCTVPEPPALPPFILPPTTRNSRQVHPPGSSRSGSSRGELVCGPPVPQCPVAFIYPPVSLQLIGDDGAPC